MIFHFHPIQLHPQIISLSLISLSKIQFMMVEMRSTLISSSLLQVASLDLLSSVFQLTAASPSLASFPAPDAVPPAVSHLQLEVALPVINIMLT